MIIDKFLIIIFFFSWMCLWWNNFKHHTRSHVDIKACSKRAIDEMLTLINPMESHFRAPLVSKNMLSPWWCENPGSMSSSLSSPKIQSMCALKTNVQCMPFFNPRRRSLPLHLYIYIYIHIYYTLHTLFGLLYLMGQSSKLGWGHKKPSNNMCPAPLWTTMQK